MWKDREMKGKRDGEMKRRIGREMERLKDRVFKGSRDRQRDAGTGEEMKTQRER